MTESVRETSHQLVAEALGTSKNTKEVNDTPLRLKLPSGRHGIIMPSILAADFGHLADEARSCFEAGASWLHVDLCDGSRVSSGALTLGPQAIAAIHRACPDLKLDVHVAATAESMVGLVKPIIDAGAARITLQWESLREIPVSKLLEAHIGTVNWTSKQHLSSGLTDAQVQRVIALIDFIHSKNVAVGLCLAPETSVEEIIPFLELGNSSEEGAASPVITYVDILAVHPGIGGQKFQEKTLKKVETIRKIEASGNAAVKSIDIAVDGGIGEDTASLAARAGANVLIAGSSIFGKNRQRPAVASSRQDLLFLKTRIEFLLNQLKEHGQ